MLYILSALAAGQNWLLCPDLTKGSVSVEKRRWYPPSGNIEIAFAVGGKSEQYRWMAGGTVGRERAIEHATRFCADSVVDSCGPARLTATKRPGGRRPRWKTGDNVCEMCPFIAMSFPEIDIVNLGFVFCVVVFGDGADGFCFLFIILYGKKIIFTQEKGGAMQPCAKWDR